MKGKLMNKTLLNNFLDSIDINHCLLTQYGRLYIFEKSQQDYYSQVIRFVSSTVRFKRLALTIPDDELYIACHKGIKNLLKERLYSYFNIE